MHGFTRTFTLTRTRSVQGVIEDATGWIGSWPFRRPISYHVGINCDSIAQSDGRLYVYRRGWTIAVGQVHANPKFTWSALLFPRHAGKRKPWAS